MAAIARGWTGSANNTAAATSLTIDITGATVGEWVFAWCQSRSAVTAQAISGWTQVGTAQAMGGGTGNGLQTLFRRKKVAGDTTFSLTWTTSAQHEALLVQYTGVHQTTPVEGYLTQAITSATSNQMPSPSSTPSFADRWAVTSHTAGSSDSTHKTVTWTAPSGMTEAGHVNNPNTTIIWNGLGVFDTGAVVTAAAHSYTATAINGGTAMTNGSSSILFLIPQVQTPTPTAIATQEAFGAPVIAQTQVPDPTGIATAEALGTHTIVTGVVSLPPANGIATAEAFGAPTITQSGGAQSVTAAGIATGEVFGSPDTSQTTPAGTAAYLRGSGSNQVASGSTTMPVTINTVPGVGECIVIAAGCQVTGNTDFPGTTVPGDVVPTYTGITFVPVAVFHDSKFAIAVWAGYASGSPVSGGNATVTFPSTCTSRCASSMIVGGVDFNNLGNGGFAHQGSGTASTAASSGVGSTAGTGMAVGFQIADVLNTVTWTNTGDTTQSSQGGTAGGTGVNLAKWRLSYNEHNTVGTVANSATLSSAANSLSVVAFIPVVQSAITGAGPSTGEASGTPSNSMTVFGSGWKDADAYGNPTIVAGAVSIAPTGIATGEALGAPTLLPGAVVVTSVAIGSGEADGVPTLIAGAATLQTVAISSAEAFGLATFSSLLTVAAVGIATGELNGNPTVSSGAIVALPNGIPTGEAEGLASLVAGAVSITAVGVATAETEGLPTASSGGVVAQPVGVSTGEAEGLPSYSVGAVVLAALGVSSGEALGTPTSLAVFLALALGIATAEASGNPGLSSVYTDQAVGIGTSEANGIPSLSALATLPIVGIPDGSLWGTPTALLGAVSLLALGIGDSSSLGTPDSFASSLSSVVSIASRVALGVPLAFRTNPRGASVPAGMVLVSNPAMQTAKIDPALMAITAAAVIQLWASAKGSATSTSQSVGMSYSATPNGMGVYSG
jgi:hypothetical protein